MSSSTKKSGTKKAKKSGTKKEKVAVYKGKGKSMDAIHDDWSELTTAQKQAVARCASAFFMGDTTTRKLNAFLEKAKQKKSKPKSTKKRAPSAFFVFAAKHRAAVKAANPGASVTDIAKKLGEQYRAQKKAGGAGEEEKPASSKKRKADDAAPLRRSPRKHKGSSA
jgi:hypothetical protein